MWEALFDPIDEGGDRSTRQAGGRLRPAATFRTYSRRLDGPPAAQTLPNPEAWRRHVRILAAAEGVNAEHEAREEFADLTNAAKTSDVPPRMVGMTAV